MHRIITTCLLVCAVSTAITAQEKNSTRKIRIKPSEFAEQCGSTIQWRDSLQQALQDSAETGKPVFWFVPTINGSFMDRKSVIEQYMMSGPFAWPAIASLLNEHFVPVKAFADGDMQRQFEQLVPYKFVEPGILVVGSDGQAKHSIDQLTTLDPYWLASLFAGWADTETPTIWSPSIQTSIDLFREQSFEEALQVLHSTPGDLSSERLLLAGMIEFRMGKHDVARATWQRAEQNKMNDPLAWRCAAEAENWGPFVRGFEVHRNLPQQAYQAGKNSRGSMSVSQVFTEQQLWKRSAEFLMNMQDEDGGWKDSDYDFGGTDSLPNVHIAVSSLCGNALLEYAQRSSDESTNKRLWDAIRRAADFCSNPENINFNDRDEILWAHAYRARFLAKLVGLNDESKTKYSAALAQAVKDLESIQTNRGTWYHEYANSFVTATALTALKRADDAGAPIDQKKIKLGVATLNNDRFDNGAYPYYGQPKQRTRGTEESSGAGMIPASAGRMPLCELGLWQWGASDDEKLQAALAAAFEHHKFLEVAYKYDNHTSTLAYGGFFFWYDMRARAEALTYMTAGTQRTDFAKRHRDLVLALPELDGCFVDSHELGRCYGTAMALLSLSLLDEIQ